MQTLNNKNNYTVRYLNLRLYVELGLIVKKVHRVLQFRQSLRLRPYILLNTERSVNKFQEGFFKMMNTNCYGKTLESKRNRVHVQLKRSTDEAQRVTDKSLMQSFEIFDENLAAVTLKQTKIYWSKPTIVEACVLELAKFHMFSFHYKVLKNAFDCQLIYSDTDSLFYEINHVALYKELAENANLRKKTTTSQTTYKITLCIIMETKWLHLYSKTRWRVKFLKNLSESSRKRTP